MEGEKTLGRDWSSLPPELLNLIAKDLREVPDFVRFRAVCTKWRFSTPVTDLPPQFPWIFETWRKHNETNLRFYSLSTNKFYTIPDTTSKDEWPYQVSELSKGYLLAKLNDNSHHTTHLSFYNPLNNSKIVLPILHNHTICWIYYCPDSDEPQLLPCQLGQDQRCQLSWCDMNRMYDEFFLNDMVFTLDRVTGLTQVTYVTADSFATVEPPFRDHFTVTTPYLLEAWGRILGVFKLYNEHDKDSVWEIHYLDVNVRGSPCWVKVKNIGNHSLFVDIGGVFMLKANDLVGIKANCIYNLYANRWRDAPMTFHAVERIDIQTGTKEHCWSSHAFSKEACWFVPNLRHFPKK